MTSEPAVSRAVTSFPGARWRIERMADSRLDLLIWTDLEDGSKQEMRFPMTTEEAHALVHGVDRVQAWSAPSAEGRFTLPFATPEAVRQHLSVEGFVVAAPDIETHTKMVQATPWANWIEELPAPVGYQIAWFVDVFAPDSDQFRQIAQAHCVRLEPSVYAGHPEPSDGG